MYGRARGCDGGIEGGQGLGVWWEEQSGEEGTGVQSESSAGGPAAARPPAERRDTRLVGAGLQGVVGPSLHLALPPDQGGLKLLLHLPTQYTRTNAMHFWRAKLCTEY